VRRVVFGSGCEWRSETDLKCLRCKGHDSCCAQLLRTVVAHSCCTRVTCRVDAHPLHLVCATVCCIWVVLQCVAVCCSVLQYVAGARLFCHLLSRSLLSVTCSLSPVKELYISLKRALNLCRMKCMHRLQKRMYASPAKDPLSSSQCLACPANDVSMSFTYFLSYVSMSFMYLLSYVLHVPTCCIPVNDFAVCCMSSLRLACLEYDLAPLCLCPVRLCACVAYRRYVVDPLHVASMISRKCCITPSKSRKPCMHQRCMHQRLPPPPSQCMWQCEHHANEVPQIICCSANDAYTDTCVLTMEAWRALHDVRCMTCVA